MISGALRPGDSFPSVRALSKEFKINPNTAHKVISQLTAQGLLEVRVGVGTIVSAAGLTSAAQRSHLLKNQVEELVVEAKKLGLEFDDVLQSLTEHWRRLDWNQKGHMK